MKKPLMVSMSALAATTAAGAVISVLAWPAQADDTAPLAFKREQDNPDVVLVADDDPDDDPTGVDTGTNTSTGTNTGKATNTRSDDSRTGARSGRDDSRTGDAMRDWTNDGPGPKVRDWTRNDTNDNSRHNTRG